MSTICEPTQLKLHLEVQFDNANFPEKMAVKHVAAVADQAVISRNGAPATEERDTDSVAEAALRKEIKRLVMNAAYAMNLRISLTWIAMYHHVAKKTQEHPTVIAARRGLPTTLDALMQIKGGPEAAMEYLLDRIDRAASVLDEETEHSLA